MNNTNINGATYVIRKPNSKITNFLMKSYQLSKMELVKIKQSSKRTNWRRIWIHDTVQLEWR